MEDGNEAGPEWGERTGEGELPRELPPLTKAYLRIQALFQLRLPTPGAGLETACRLCAARVLWEGGRWSVEVLAEHAASHVKGPLLRCRVCGEERRLLAQAEAHAAVAHAEDNGPPLLADRESVWELSRALEECFPLEELVRRPEEELAALRESYFSLSSR